MMSHEFVSFIFLALPIFSSLQVFAQAHPSISLPYHSIESSSPFSIALETLQTHIGYHFESVGLLRRAMTHASYSEENNKALSILGANVIETSISLQSLGKDLDISAKDLNSRISKISNVESCAANGLRLGLEKVIRVSPKTDSSTPVVVCGAFRAIFGAIAIDTEKSDEAATVFWSVLDGKIGRALAR